MASKSVLKQESSTAEPMQILLLPVLFSFLLLMVATAAFAVAPAHDSSVRRNCSILYTSDGDDVIVNEHENEDCQYNGNNVEVYDYDGEVVGASGRIGSFLLRAASAAAAAAVTVSNNKRDGNDQRIFAAVSRSETPGMKSRPGCPILVSIPATEVKDGEFQCARVYSYCQGSEV